MQNPGETPRDEHASDEDVSNEPIETEAQATEAPTEHVAPVDSPDDGAAEAPTELMNEEQVAALLAEEDVESKDETDTVQEPASTGGAEITRLPLPKVASDETSDTHQAASTTTPSSNQNLAIPVERQSLAQEFWGFIVHNKAWWMTPIILVLALMVAFILFAETSPVLPFIYTVI